MKQKLTGGAMIDLLTKGELDDSLRAALKSWMVELTRGARMRRWQVEGTVDGAGSLLMGENRDGPQEGMVWGISRFSVVGSTIPAAGLGVYANEVSRSTVLVANLQRDLYPGERGVFLFGGDTLRIAGAGLVPGDTVAVTMSIREVPAQMAWSL